MLILLPPSETKRLGGTGGVLNLEHLGFGGLTETRERLIDDVVALAGDPDQARRVLKLSSRQAELVTADATLRTAPTAPAVDRYTGVLYDALAAREMDASARAWLGVHVVIQSALFGPIFALDPIPAYRLSASTRLPGREPLHRVWAAASTAALACEPGPVIDLRSEAYRALGPVPHEQSAYVRVVTETASGRVRALNHFNKKAKGAFVRALAQARPEIASPADLTAWAHRSGWRMRPGAAGELDLVVD